MAEIESNSKYEEAFLAHVVQARVQAKVVSGHAAGQTRPFVPIDALRGPSGFFSEDTIRSLLNYYYSTSVRIHWPRVQKSFLAIFATLITIGKGSYLHHFMQNVKLTDPNLPFTSTDGWHKDCRSFFAQFYEAQWQFCAQIFETDWMNETCLDDQIILPIIDYSCLKYGPDAYTYRIKLHPSYDRLQDRASGGITTNEYLLKTCKHEHAQYHYNEVGAYRILSERMEVQPYMPQFYGSWTISDTHYMLLEYVEGGTLTQFMERNDPPEGPEELRQFWSALLKTAIPVMRIHSFPVLGQTHLNFQGIHHDIKTDNILVGVHVDTSNPVEPPSGPAIVFKVADLGMTDIMNLSEEMFIALRDRPGTQTYSAPENFVHEDNEIHYRTARKAHPSKDIWALGCVFVQAMVWSVLGPKGLADFHAARATEISKIPKLKHSAYSDCFHDGIQVLEIVSVYRRKACQSKRGFDEFVLRVGELVQRMLSPVKHRVDAEQVWVIASDILKEVESISQDARYSDFWKTGSPLSDSQITSQRRSLNVGPTTGLGVTGIDAFPDTRSPDTSQKSPQNPRRSVQLSSQPFHRIPPPELPTGMPGPIKTSPAERRDSISRSNMSSIDHAPSFGKIPQLQPWYQRSFRPPLHHETAIVDTNGDSRRHIMDGHPSENALESKLKKHRSRVSAPTAVPNPTRPELPTMLIKDIIKWIPRTRGQPKSLPYNGDILLKKLNGRDQIFLIDDSGTMNAHWDAVKDAFIGLAYLVKRSDYDGMELRFTNNTAVQRSAKHRSPLIKMLNTIQPGGKCDIGLSFGQIINRINLDNESRPKRRSLSQHFKREKNKWGTNIYVLTTGMWDEESDWLPGIVDPLKDLMRRKVQTREVGVQFIQFGDDAGGTARLKKLDDKLAEHGVERDMVDTTHISGNVFKMLLGCFDPNWDHCDSPRIPSPASISGWSKEKKFS